MCPVGLFDQVTVASAVAPGIVVTANTRDIPWDETNLAHRAASLFAETMDSPLPVAIHLEKNIPPGAGLGGGSSNAAAVLLLLNEITEAGFSLDQLTAMAASLGSDVPFFCLQHAALATGRGERLRPVSLRPPFWVVLVMPSLAVSTAWAYQSFRVGRTNKAVSLPHAIDLRACEADFLFNDLESVVLARYPELHGVKEALLDQGAWGSLLSGSGSTVFGVFFERDAALEAQENLCMTYADRSWRVAAVPGLV
jgi:4-diphosphocytidyl-2-C-methyl-D-erythritol kinase